MRKIVFLLLAGFAFYLLPGFNVMAKSPLHYNGSAKLLSPVCVVSGLTEIEIQAFQTSLCAEATRLLFAHRSGVEALALNDPRLSEPNRLIIGIRGHVEAIEGTGAVLTLTANVNGAQRIVPTAAHVAPYEATITPAIREALRKCLHEQGLL
ncbi:hypothetical protein [Asticcacaulis sp.]|uniref:hypothetical protein n=1 Tax=Asticcacaulis sp. TaxID=1872648 RepID=UPI003F7C721A